MWPNSRLWLCRMKRVFSGWWTFPWSQKVNKKVECNAHVRYDWFSMILTVITNKCSFLHETIYIYTVLYTQYITILHIYISVYEYIHIYIYICIHIYILYTYIYVYICIYIRYFNRYPQQDHLPNSGCFHFWVQFHPKAWQTYPGRLYGSIFMPGRYPIFQATGVRRVNHREDINGKNCHLWLLIIMKAIYFFSLSLRKHAEC